MSEIKHRLEELRRVMKKEGVYAYLIPTDDFHGSEYVNDHFKVREFFSGFTGSAGTLLVTLKEALLWTDGRYFIQADKELEGSGIKLMKSGEEKVHDICEYLKENMPKKSVLGFDGRTVSAKKGKKLKESAPKISYKKDLSEGIFLRPSLPGGRIENLPEELTGMSAIDKIAAIRQKLKEEKADGIFIGKLDDIAYILNIRGSDIEYNPVTLAYLYISADKAYIFTGNGKTEIAYHGIIEKPYTEVVDFLKKGDLGDSVMLDPDSVNYLHYKLIKKRARVIEKSSIAGQMKAVKNETELKHLKEIYLKDSVALTRFIKYLCQTDEMLTECSAADKLLEYRKEIDEFKGLSFETISAYGKNAAIIHYEPSRDNDTEIEKKGLYMVDSGGQYEGGTTDVTRTIVRGETDDDEKAAFTLVAAGMLKLADAVFMKGTKGSQLDILAREDLWKKGMNYRHGTGHGVGYMLNVHEGPHSVRNKPTEDEAPLEPGMLVSDEPGVYKEEKFGVRLENILLVEKAFKSEDGEFYRFKPLTLVPIDHKAMDLSYLNDRETALYRDYQKEVYEALKDRLSEEERKWLISYSGLSDEEISQ